MSGFVADRSDDDLRRILTDTRTIAMIGASANPARPSHAVLGFLLRKGFRVFPINPGQAGRAIFGTTFLPDLASVSEPVDMVDVFRAGDALPGILDEMMRLPVRPRVLWTQLGVRHDETAERAQAAGIDVVMDRCPKIEFARLSL